MKYQISIAEAAEKDIHESFLWYEKKSKNLGKKFESQILKSIGSITHNPFKFQVRYSNIRVCYLNFFPFGIHFRIRENKSSVLIVGVFHTARNSEIWESRL